MSRRGRKTQDPVQALIFIMIIAGDRNGRGLPKIEACPRAFLSSMPHSIVKTPIRFEDFHLHLHSNGTPSCLNHMRQPSGIE